MRGAEHHASWVARLVPQKVIACRSATSLSTRPASVSSMSRGTATDGSVMQSARTSIWPRWAHWAVFAILSLLIHPVTFGQGPVDLNFPLEGHYREGRYMPARVDVADA